MCVCVCVGGRRGGGEQQGYQDWSVASLSVTGAGHGDPADSQYWPCRSTSVNLLG